MEELKKQLLDAAVNATTMEEKQVATMNYLTVVEQERKNQETSARISIDQDRNDIQKEANSLQRLALFVGLAMSIGGFVGGMWYDKTGNYMSQPFTKAVVRFGEDFMKKIFPHK